MLPDEPLYPQVYPATFTDAFGTEETVIVNHGPSHLRPPYLMRVRGLTFRSSERFGYWFLSEGDRGELTTRFPACGENDRLCEFNLWTMIPVPVQNTHGVREETALLLHVWATPPGDIGETLAVEGSICCESRWFVSDSGNKRAGWYNDLEGCLWELQTQGSTGCKIQVCANCRFSARSPYADSWELDCLQLFADELIVSRSDLIYASESIDLSNSPVVLETHWCPHFSPHPPGRGSRN